MILTNKYNLPDGIVNLIKSRDITKDDPYRIGITTLIRPPLINYLTKQHWNELTEYISDYLWAITGQAYHYILSKISVDNILVEKKVEVKIDEFTVVGILDLYDEKKLSLEDYKVTSVWSILEGVKPEWEEQLNCYVWLLRKCDKIPEQQKEVKELYINAILRDWNRSQLAKSKDGKYPPIPFVRLKVRLWSFEEQEKFVKEKLEIQKKIINAKTQEDIEICSPENRWKKPDTFAVYKNKNKTASRVLGTKEEAEKWILNTGDTKNTYRIEERKGYDNKCKDYCAINKFCRYGKQYCQ